MRKSWLFRKGLAYLLSMGMLASSVTVSAQETQDYSFETAEAALESMEETTQTAPESSEDITEAAPESMEETTQAAPESVEDTTETVPESVEDTTEAVPESVEDTTEAAPESAEESTEESTEVASESAEETTEAAQEIPETSAETEEETLEEETLEEGTLEEGTLYTYYADARLNSDSGVYDSWKSEGQVLTSLPAGTRVYVTGMVTSGAAALWARIIFETGDYSCEGYIPAYALTITSEGPLMLTGDLQSFPEDYQASLKALQEKHPNWIFKPVYVGDTFDYAVSQQIETPARALVTMSYNECYRSLLDRDYDWQTNTWKQWEPNWAGASEETVRYYMDPRNFLNEDRIFMFESLTYEEYQTEQAVEAALSGTFMDHTNVPGEAYTYAWLFVWVGEKYNISPVALASRVLQEQGLGNSGLISGTYPGYEGLYNYFNLQATGSTKDEIIRNGLEEAKTGSTIMLPDDSVSTGSWDTPAKALIGGALKFANQYILRNQNTLYAQKFDYDDQYNGKYWHQYMTNIMAPYMECYSVKKSYSATGQLDNSFVFLIPVYEDRPEQSPKPRERKNFNNCLQSILVNGKEAISSFDKEQRDFYFYVGGSTIYANVKVTASSSSAQVSYVSPGSLSGKAAVCEINVTAEDGSEAAYRLIIGRGVEIEEGFFADFDPYSYRKRYPELEEIYGNDINGYYEHYLLIGADKGWDGSKGDFPEDGGGEQEPPSTVYNGIDYAPVFGARYYLERYADLKAAFGDDTAAALKHFVEYGIKEGRRGSADFSIAVYRSNYADLEAAFGRDNAAYVDHYLSYGINEGRNGAVLLRDGIAEAENGKKYYYSGGSVDKSFTGLAEYHGERCYVENGAVREDCSGLVQIQETWYYLEKGIVNSTYNSLAYYNGGWFYIEKGVINWSYTGLVYYGGGWFYVDGGVLDWNYTGLVYYGGGWFYVDGGVLDWSYTGLVYYGGAWFYVSGGVLDWSYTGLVYYGGGWFYVNGGILDWTFTGLVYYSGCWFYVKNGAIDWSYSGLAQHNGNLFFIKNGSINWNYSGRVWYNGTWYRIVNGVAVK